jgi:hypothetical protein
VRPASGTRRQVTAEGPLAIDIDASLVHVHFEKEQAVGTYNAGYGFSPMIAMADYGRVNGTGEILAVMMRPGNKDANSHNEVLTRAWAQLPEDFYDGHGNLIGKKIPVRTDSAGPSREFPDHLHFRGIQFSNLLRTARVQRAPDRVDQRENIENRPPTNLTPSPRRVGHRRDQG